MTQPRGEPEHVQLLLGVYAFGILSGDEAELVERHLTGCAACRGEYTELAAVLPFLALLGSDEVLSMPVRLGRDTGARPPEREARRRRPIAPPPPATRPAPPPSP
jgi:hypothetical protein